MNKVKGRLSETPCLGCGDRRVGCHGECAYYTAWRKARDEMITRENARKSAENGVTEIEIRKYRKAGRRF